MKPSCGFLIYVCVCVCVGLILLKTTPSLSFVFSVPEFKKEVESYTEKGSSYMNISNG